MGILKKTIAIALSLIFMALLMPMTASAANGSSADSSNKTIVLVVLAVVAFLIALLICLAWRSKMKTAKIARSADNYIPDGGFKLTGHGDIFLYRTVTRTKIEKASSSSSSGGRPGGRPGGGGRA